MRIVSGCMPPTPTDYSPFLAGFQPAEFCRQQATLSLTYCDGSKTPASSVNNRAHHCPTKNITTLTLLCAYGTQALNELYKLNI